MTPWLLLKMRNFKLYRGRLLGGFNSRLRLIRAYDLQTLFERYPQASNDEERRALLPMNLKPTVEMGLG